MENFSLLINGKNFNTGKYEYFPYVDRKITDFKTTFRILTKLKIGKISEDSKEVSKYIFAKYCIGRDDSNRLAIKAAYKAFKEFRNFSLSIRKKILLDMYELLIKKRMNLLIYLSLKAIRLS